MVKKYIPRQGDVVSINFNPQSGREQSGKRSAVVVSPSVYNQKVGLALFCPITKQQKGYPFEVSLPKNLVTTGVILSDHLKNLDWQSRKARFIERLPSATLLEVLGKVNVLVRKK